MTEKKPETGQGTKRLIGQLSIALSILISTGGLCMKIQKLVDGLTTVTEQHNQIFDVLMVIKLQQQEMLDRSRK